MRCRFKAPIYVLVVTSLDREREREALAYSTAYADPVARTTIRLWITRGLIELLVCVGAIVAAAAWEDSLADLVAIAAGIVGGTTTFLSVRARHVLRRHAWRKEGAQFSTSSWANGGSVLRFNDEPGRVFMVLGSVFSSLEAIDQGSKLLVAGTKRHRVISTLDRGWMRAIGRPRLAWIERRMWKSISRR